MINIIFLTAFRNAKFILVNLFFLVVNQDLYGHGQKFYILNDFNDQVVSLDNSSFTVTAIGVGTTCNKPNAMITVTAANGTPPYTYSIDGVNFQASSTFTGLGAGDFTVTARDATGQLSSTSLTLTNTFPGPEFGYAHTDPTSCSAADGTDQVSGANGLAPYWFSFDNINYQTNGNFTNLAAGLYTLFERDANGCTASYTLAVTTNCVQNYNYHIVNPGCNNNDGSITILSVPCCPLAAFSINGSPFQSSGTFTNLPAGIYAIAIKDINGVVNTRGFSLYYDCTFAISTVVKDADCGVNDGSILATGINGLSPYQYSIDGVNFVNSGNFSNLAPGDYTVKVRDPNELTNIAVVTIHSCPTVSAVETDENCGNKDGTITATAMGARLHISIPSMAQISRRTIISAASVLATTRSR